MAEGKENHKHVLPSVTKEEMAALDRQMIEAYGITLVVMMENAGSAFAEYVREQYAAVKRIAVVVGSGNNGGGGMAAARHLYNMGFEVSVVTAAPQEKMKEAPRMQAGILERIGVSIKESRAVGDAALEAAFQEADLLVDALLGYNVQGDVRGEALRLVNTINKSGAPVVSLDVPSGLDPDSGAPHGVAVKADTTVTLALPKAGLVKPEAREYVGALFVADISVPRTWYNAHGVAENLFQNGRVVPVSGRQ